MSIPMKAKRNFPYAGHQVRKGQDFDASTSSDARFLKEVGYAEERKAVTVPAPQPYSTRMMTAEVPAPVLARHAPSDDLDSMDAESLHALAGRIGVYVHHRAGAERVRHAIRSHRVSNAE